MPIIVDRAYTCVRADGAEIHLATNLHVCLDLSIWRELSAFYGPRAERIVPLLSRGSAREPERAFACGLMESVL